MRVAYSVRQKLITFGGPLVEIVWPFHLTTAQLKQIKSHFSQSRRRMIANQSVLATYFVHFSVKNIDVLCSFIVAKPWSIENLLHTMEEDFGMTKKENNAGSAATSHNNNHNFINPLLVHPSMARSMSHHPKDHYRSLSSWRSFPPSLQKQNKDHYRNDNPWQQQHQQGQLYLRYDNHHCRVLPHPVHHGYHVYHHNIHHYRSTRFVGLPVLSSSKSQPRQQQKQKHQEQQKIIDIGFTQQDREALSPLTPQKQQHEKKEYQQQQQQSIDIDFSKEEEKGQKQQQPQQQCIDIGHSQEKGKPFAVRPPPLPMPQKQLKKQPQQKQGDVTVEDGSKMDTTSEQFLPEDNAAFRSHHNEDSKPRRIDHEEKWMEMFQKLVTYKEQHENSMFSKQFDEDLSLGRWVIAQRAVFNRNKMREDRINLLDSIGFDWGRGLRQLVPWMEMYERLVVYKRDQNGSTNVFSFKKCDKRLGSWVSRQRTDYRRRKLSDDRISLLNTIDFDWKVEMGRGKKRKVSSTISSAITNDEKWIGMFQKLVAYKDQYENTKVPNRYDEDPSLGRWVGTQRRIFNQKKMQDNRSALLDSIAFDWNVLGRTEKKPKVPSTISSAAATSTNNERSYGEDTTRRFTNSDSNKIDMMTSSRKKLCTSNNTIPVITKRTFAADCTVPAAIGCSIALSSSSSSSLSSSLSAYSFHDRPVSVDVDNDNDRKDYDDDTQNDDDDDDNDFIII
jgi:hypothetical protein